MTDRVESTQATVPAGTTIAVPFTALANMPDGRVRRVEIAFPDGCSGLVGAQLVYAGVAVMPRSRGEFLFGNDRVYSWESGDLPTGSQWGIRAVNSDIYDHMLEVVFYCDELVSRATGAAGGLGTSDAGMLPPIPSPTPEPTPEPPSEPLPPEPTPEPGPEPPGPAPTPGPIPPQEMTEMPTCIITDTGHPTEHFACWPSGLVRRLGASEFRFYQSHNVPTFGPGDQVEYGRLKAVADAVAGL